MNLKTVKFFDIPNEISILKLLNQLNRQFQVQVHEYKGVGFIKREAADEKKYDLIVEFRKAYLMNKILKPQLIETGGYKLVIDNHEIFYRVVGMKYLVCEMRDMSALKDKTLKFKTLENQNVLDIIAKVIGKARFDIDYIISNKNVSYVAMKRSVDATQLLILLKNQNYEVDWSNIYHDYEYFSTESQYLPQAKKLPQKQLKLQNQYRRFNPYNRANHKPTHNSDSVQDIRILESRLEQTNSKLNNLMKDLASKHSDGDCKISGNNTSQQQQSITGHRQESFFNPYNILCPPNYLLPNLMQQQSLPIHQSGPRIPTFNPFINNSVGNNNLNPNHPFYCYYPYNM